MKRVLAIILVIAISLTVLAGCSGNERLAYDAMVKLADANSLETESQYSVKVDIDGLSEEEKKNAQPVLAFINDIIVKSSYQKEKSADGNILSEFIKNDVDLGGISVKFDIWSKEENNNGETNSTYIVKVPTLLTLALSGEYSGKRYFVYDENEVNKVINETYPEGDINIGYSSEMKALQKELTDYFLKNTSLLTNLGFNFIQKTGNQNEYGTEYLVKLDDKQLKSLLRCLVNDLGKDSKFIEIMKKFVKSYAESVSEPQGLSEDEKQQIDEFLDSGMLLTYANAIFDELENVQILGDKGIEIACYINDEGYIIDEKGAIDIQFDPIEIGNAFMQAIANAGESEFFEPIPQASEEKMVIKLQIDFTSHVKSVNKALNIAMPAVNDSNSVNYADIIKEQLEEQKKFEEEQKKYEEQQKELQKEILARDKIIKAAAKKGYKASDYFIVINDDVVSYPTVILKKNNRVLMPAKKFGEMADIDVNWNSSKKTVTAKKGKTTIVFTSNSNVAKVNGVRKKMDVAVTVLEGRPYIPLRFTAEKLGGKVKFNSHYGEIVVNID